MSKVMIYGYGISGTSAEKLLKSKGYLVTVVDDKKAMQSKDAMNILDEQDFIVISPGISLENDFIKYAISEDIKIISEIELANIYYRGKIIAITGTNGKTSTVSMIDQLLKYSGLKSKIAGNGYDWEPFSKVALENESLDFLVLEVSAQQLETTYNLKPYIAAITTLAINHTDRFINEDYYYKQKLKIFNNSSSKAYHIINNDLDYVRKKYVNSNTKKVIISLKGEEDIYIKDNIICYKEEAILDINTLDLGFRSFISNYMIALAVAKILNLDNEVIKNFFYNYKRLPHRFEKFLDNSKGTFINNSKATSIEATQTVLSEFQEPVILICGGKSSELDFNEFVKVSHKKLHSVYLIGELTEYLYNLFIKFMPIKSVFKCYEMDKMINKLEKNVTCKLVVIFSPTASSLDQFESYKHRGEEFKKRILKKFNEKE